MEEIENIAIISRAILVCGFEWVAATSSVKVQRCLFLWWKQCKMSFLSHHDGKLDFVTIQIDSDMEFVTDYSRNIGRSVII